MVHMKSLKASGAWSYESPARVACWRYKLQAILQLLENIRPAAPGRTSPLPVRVRVCACAREYVGMRVCVHARVRKRPRGGGGKPR